MIRQSSWQDQPGPQVEPDPRIPTEYLMVRRMAVAARVSDAPDVINPPLPRMGVDRRSEDADVDLVERLRSGDRTAFRQLFEQYGPTLNRLAMRYVSTAAQAEDVVQDTWLAVLESIDRFQGRSSFRTWVCTILVYKAQRQAGRDRRVLPFGVAFAERETGDGNGPTPGARRRVLMIAPDGSGEPASVFTANQVMAMLQRLIDTLPARQRAAVVMVDVEGRPAEEVCETLGVTPGNLRMLLHRGRVRVRMAWPVA